MSESHHSLQSDLDLLMDRVIDLETEVEHLRDQVDQRDERIETLEVQVKDLESRTDLLQLVDDSDELDGKQRSTALLQHAQQKAQRNGGSVAIDQEDAQEILHYPDIHRTTYYSDFQRCARLVGNDRVCRYESDRDEARLIVDLRGDRSLPDDVTESTGGV